MMSGCGSRHVLPSAVALGFVIFALLWLLSVQYRHVYVPRQDDVTVLADGLLLLPGAKWTDWFTRGDSYFFDVYPEWPWRVTPFARPVFEFAIYLGHFLFCKNWGSYLAINYLSVAGMAAVAFSIARTALGLRTAASMLSAVLVLLSPAVLASSLMDLSLASESLASVLVGCGFMAVVARRDWLCAVLLMIALLTKETAVWAPFAAALTVLLRPEREGGPRRPLAAAGMLVPFVLWLGLRLAFYGGIEGGYATAYSPLAGFLRLTGWKLTHLDYLFVMQEIPVTEGRWALADLAFRVGMAVLVLLLLLPWALTGLRAARDRVKEAVRGRRWPAADGALLVTLWGGLGLAFHFALTVSNPSYASTAVMFAWPAVVAEAARRGLAIRIGLAACSVLSLAQMSHFLVGIFLPPLHPYMALNFEINRSMQATLRQVPADVRQIFIISSPAALAPADPAYLRAFLGLSAEIVHIVNMDWTCTEGGARVSFDHSISIDGVTISATLPGCATFEFDNAQIQASAFSGGHLRRNDSIMYELPQAHFLERSRPTDPGLEVGRAMIVHVHPRGAARFIIEHGGADGGPASFDVP
jgi:hypothetical protein